MCGKFAFTLIQFDFKNSFFSCFSTETNLHLFIVSIFLNLNYHKFAKWQTFNLKSICCFQIKIELILLQNCRIADMMSYWLARLGGNSSPTFDDVKRIVESAGININAAHIQKVIADFQGKDIEDVMAAGMY